jgi:hypothetical protein
MLSGPLLSKPGIISYCDVKQPDTNKSLRDILALSQAELTSKLKTVTVVGSPRIKLAAHRARSEAKIRGRSAFQPPHLCRASLKSLDQRWRSELDVEPPTNGGDARCARLP